MYRTKTSLHKVFNGKQYHSLFLNADFTTDNNWNIEINIFSEMIK